jgi:hypothetical protein
VRFVSLVPHLSLRGVNAVWNTCDGQCDIDVRRDFNQCGTMPIGKEKEGGLDWLYVLRMNDESERSGCHISERALR